jgi:hypothetical protein
VRSLTHPDEDGPDWFTKFVKNRADSESKRPFRGWTAP